MLDPRREVIRETYTLRVHAPREVVWEEMETVDLLLAHIEQVVHSVVDDQKVSATFRGRLRWGPFGWNLSGVAAVGEVTPLERLTFSFEVPNIGASQHGVFDLAVASAEETNLTFTAEMRLGRVAKTVRHLVDETTEGYVRAIVTGIAARAENHWLAEQRLRQRPPLADEQ